MKQQQHKIWYLLRVVGLILCCALLAGCSPMLAPTSSWPGTLKVRSTGSDNSEQYQRSNLGNLPRTLNFPAPHSEDRYHLVNPRHQYQYGSYQRHNLDSKSHSLDYDLEAPYQHEVNMYEYSYTESSNYNDQNKKYSGASGRRIGGGGRDVGGREGAGREGGGREGGGREGGGRLSRRYEDSRVWWPPVPMPVLGRGESYLGRSGSSQRMERPLNAPDGGDQGRFHYSASEEGSMTGTDHRTAYDSSGIVVQNDSLITMVRVQKSLQPGREIHRRDFAIVQSIEPTTVIPGSPKPKQRGFDSLLKMMTEAGEEEGVKSNTVRSTDSNTVKNVVRSTDFHSSRNHIVEVPAQVNNNNNNNYNYNSNSYSTNNSSRETNSITMNRISVIKNATGSMSSKIVEPAETTKVEHLPRVGDSGEPGTHVTTTAVVGSIMLLIIILMVMVALRVQWRERVKETEEWSPRSPTVQPPTPAATSMGPPIPPNPLDPLNHLQAEPIRIKAKGLLERRGSNTSLTLELAPNCPPPEVTSPPRHCTPEEFLMTAGNRMSRRQLRNCLRDTRSLHAEFWEVPLNHPDKCDVPGSGAKNRYRTVLPNEATRVRLYNGDPINDYINANYVRGYDGEEKAYIVTQGPLAHTVADLWTLVMQEKSPAVVMITRLKEKRRVKCEPYVPAFNALYGDITVTVKQVIQKNGYTIRQVVLQRGDIIHEALHFWYTAWPDHKTPTEPNQLLSMCVQVDHIRKSGEGGIRGPVVVHCSAGIGRSGCFVGISIAINQLLEEDCVDILGTLCQMRLDRGGMVQTGEQYEFIHRAVALYEATLPIVCSGK